MNVRQELTAALGQQVLHMEGVGGGCIANAAIVTMEDGARYFVKSMPDDQAPFLQEAHGLEELAKANALRIPSIQHATPQLLLLEYIEQAPRRTDFMEALGRGLAAQHRVTSAHYGFYEDNLIGATTQPNVPSDKDISWPAFYWQYRLKHQLKVAEQQGIATDDLRRWMGRLEPRIEGLLSGSEERPALLHGDLWSGNVISDERGEPCLIDPAVSYGHREAELGMTHLFGGFSQRFYDAYEEAFPLSPGHKERLGLYKLYHVFNHFNLFGHTYYEQTLSLIKRYV
ncbi:MAG TPA: fructosamine kinase [Myxococcales bacterium]|nr:fructosamine kinase [Deltaproteobacteria bacterium]MBU50506.1 fructosamine kinase [Deltaproteobacteria bacterium]HAA57981.1 fructosamine kinase [Myxococcales bacterium]|tara:strand:- start:7158 stop:8012 length:855 start_codon:yes stop_codon:yes gene_type:complete